MKKKTIKEWVDQSNQVHDGRYKYLTDQWPVNYSSSKVSILCPVHGSFKQRIKDHVRGSGCRTCSMKKVGKNNSKPKEYYVDKFVKVHGDRYSYDEDWCSLENNKTIIPVICKTHGRFEISINNHENGSGCQKCGIEERTVKRSYSVDEWLEVFAKIHNDQYEYPIELWPEITNMNCVVKVLCKIHGFFNTSLNQHQRGHGCPACSNRFFKYAYVNLVENSYLKFGVTNNIKARLNRFKTVNRLELENLHVWEFDNSTNALEAESFIKNEIETGVVSKSHMKEGYTETTNVENLDFIKSVFLEFGGKQLS